MTIFLLNIWIAKSLVRNFLLAASPEHLHEKGRRYEKSDAGQRLLELYAVKGVFQVHQMQQDIGSFMV